MPEIPSYVRLYSGRYYLRRQGKYNCSWLKIPWIFCEIFWIITGSYWLWNDREWLWQHGEIFDYDIAEYYFSEKITTLWVSFRSFQNFTIYFAKKTENYSGGLTTKAELERILLQNRYKMMHIFIVDIYESEIFRKKCEASTQVCTDGCVKSRVIKSILCLKLCFNKNRSKKQKFSCSFYFVEFSRKSLFLRFFRRFFGPRVERCHSDQWNSREFFRCYHLSSSIWQLYTKCTRFSEFFLIFRCTKAAVCGRLTLKFAEMFAGWLYLPKCHFCSIFSESTTL